jgi:hypothetical protein
MVSRWNGSAPGSLALAPQRGQWWRFSWSMAPRQASRGTAGLGVEDVQRQRRNQFRYHLHRGRRAREAGQYEQGVAEARRALGVNANDPWALALLGQCLQRQRASDLHGARAALERAWSLEPTNGYFVGLLLDVLTAQGDGSGCMDLLTWAWWRGAPVERWLPNGLPMPRHQAGAVATSDGPGERRELPSDAPLWSGGAGSPPHRVGRAPAQTLAG